MERLTDVVDLYRDDVAAGEFTDETPFLVSDGGRERLTRQLRWRAMKYALVAVVAPVVGLLFVFGSA